ncbi:MULTISPECIES: enoyl-CoA hydratase/isomerase family protein [unclassified Haladaptatus]|uniref:enoyl-CoA hydratase/isomerase family protein n=1 Tax=unclassified Haladaptatus TaxID=2622732 RepID=UPI0023E7CB50|nr:MULTISPECIES: enoyl-CoA hydratase-related protein [unclassified Haladaptatus]
MSEYEYVSTDQTDAVHTIRIDRPAAHNSFDRQLAAELREATYDAVSRDDVRCLVLRGTGATFCTGADLGTLDGDETDESRLRHLATDLHAIVSALVHAPMPVVTGVNGVAAGGGLGLALCGDIVLAAESARFEFAYPRIGLSGDGGSTYFLPRLVGLRQAQRLTLRDEPVGSEEAVDLGLVTERVADEAFDAHLADLAASVASGPTAAYAETRRLLHESFDNTLSEQLTSELDRIAGLANTDDFTRGHDAFFEKSPAEFEGR